MAIRRRRLIGSGLAGAAAAILPAPSRAAGVLTFIPQSDLAGLDPIWSTQTAARNHGYMVFDTLFATDAALAIRPQMAEALETQAGGLVALIRLRPGLRFHDGEPVRARDCVASIRRWAARDPVGRLLVKAARDISAPDERTIRFDFITPFPGLAYALGKLSTPVPFMMPERLAATPPTAQIKEAIGSGPFRFNHGEWLQGSRMVYDRFDGYVPRDEPSSGTAGGKVVNVDRVVWTVIPDPATALATMQTGRADWFEYPPQDLVPALERDRSIAIRQLDPLGFITVGRMNHAQPPFDNPKVRQALAAAIDQRSFMDAAIGDPRFFRECRAFLPCGSPWTRDDAASGIGAGIDQARRLLAASGYDGTAAVVLAATDNQVINACATVAFDVMRQIGMKAELVAVDVASLMRRRVSHEPAGKGGWSFFVTFSGAAGASNPADFAWLQADGASAPPGWPDDPRLQAMLAEFLAAPDDAARRQLGEAIGSRAAEVLPFLPLGQFQQPTAVRTSISGIVPGGAVMFWGLRKS